MAALTTMPIYQFESPLMAINVIKIFVLGTFSFLAAFLFTPALTHFLYKYKLWRKEVRDQALDGAKVPVFQKFHSEGEVKTPRFGGTLIWLGTLFTALVFFLLSKIDVWWLQKLNFLSQSQTWLPLFTLIAASSLGLVDDILQVIRVGPHAGRGLSVKQRLVVVTIIGLIGAWWFYAKLGGNSIHVPGVGDFIIGVWYIPLFVVTMLAIYSGGVIDGIDGLSGGVFATIYGAFAFISLWRGQIDLAAFCIVILGTILAFLWFNIPPARFYLSETGTLGLCATITVVAFLTDSVLVLPIIAFLLVAESASVIIQLASKRFRGKKVFLAAPIHHHFEALGWPSYKVTMRFWIISIVMAIVGVVIRLMG